MMLIDCYFWFLFAFTAECITSRYMVYTYTIHAWLCQVWNGFVTVHKCRGVCYHVLDIFDSKQLMVVRKQQLTITFNIISYTVTLWLWESILFKPLYNKLADWLIEIYIYWYIYPSYIYFYFIYIHRYIEISMHMMCI
jgi:hypothetical protein